MTSRFFEDLIGQRISGGCDDCSAWQELIRQRGFYVIVISHDDTCPLWQQIQTQREGTP